MKHIIQTMLFTLFAVLLMPVSASDKQVNNSNRLILVSGATGQQGGAVARELLRRGYKLRGLTRNPASDKAKALTAMGIEMVQGDFDDASSLDAALAGTYGAYSMQNWRGIGAEGEIRHGKAMADAAKRAGVKHFVYSSVAAAGEKSGVPTFDSKIAIEDHIKAIGLPYTIIRPATFMTNFNRSRQAILAGTYRGPLAPQKKYQFIAVSDIGRFVAEAFDDPKTWLGRSIKIAGDEKTNTEIAEIFSRVLGRSVKYEQVPWDKFVDATPAVYVAMVSWFKDGGYAIDTAALRKEFPWMLTIEQYLRQSGWQGAK